MSPSLMGPYSQLVFGATDVLPHYLFIAVPLIEILIGVGLLTRRLRRTSMMLAVASHLLILLLFILGRRNSVIWPWNAAMAAFVIILFWRAQEDSINEILLPKKIGLHALALLAFGIMPVFGLFNLWDSYLSYSLYSGSVSSGVVYISELTTQRLPTDIQVQVERSRSDGRLFIRPCGWSMRELNVPCYPERRVFIHITRRLCEYAEDSSAVSLKFSDKANRLNGSRQTSIYHCSEL